MMNDELLPHATKTIDLNSLKITQVRCGYGGYVVAIEVEDLEGRKAVYALVNPESK